MSAAWRTRILSLAGRVILENGGETYRAEDTVTRMAHALGMTEVDVFAPGDGINSTVPHNGYRNFKGTSMAAPVVSGVAALVWNYFPELTMEEVRRAVLEGVTKRTGEEVMSPGLRRNRGTVKFEELCSTAGVVNALGAVKVAEKISKDKK